MALDEKKGFVVNDSISITKHHIPLDFVTLINVVRLAQICQSQ